MPQLEVVYILTIYLLAWLTLALISLKIKTFTLTTKPMKQPPQTYKSTTPPLPWT
uniref:ATP synthase F0 subunit 8 n=1 Tax=Deinagkistrodon acutus TaxID=36307 RepID=A0A0M3SUB0_DEIAC|nr:ATP synthase F0 subunit 8 [Deinagkistrodon acutus]